jgi:drug/metabolite transporter (DMT)-like permease
MLNDALTAPPSLASITIMGSGRLGPTITALLGLAAAVLAARTLARAKRPANQTSSAERDHRPTALLLGMTAVLLGVLFLAAADGGPGTGNGVVGSAAAIVLGFIAIGLDRLAATRATEPPRGPAGETREVT